MAPSAAFLTTVMWIVACQTGCSTSAPEAMIAGKTASQNAFELGEERRELPSTWGACDLMLMGHRCYRGVDAPSSGPATKLFRGVFAQVGVGADGRGRRSAFTRY